MNPNGRSNMCNNRRLYLSFIITSWVLTLQTSYCDPSTMFYRQQCDDDEVEGEEVEEDDDDDDVAIISLASSRSADSDQGQSRAAPVINVREAYDIPGDRPLHVGLSKQLSQESMRAQLQLYPSNYERNSFVEMGPLNNAVVSSNVGFPSSGDTGSSLTDSDLTTTSQDVNNVPQDPPKNKTRSRAMRPNSAQRLLSRRQFHRGYFVRARYGAHARDVETPAAKQTIFRPPSAFCAPLRYAQEPRATKARKQKPTNSSRWPEPPRYPPKARHVGVGCDILRLVEQLHVHIQCQPDVSDAAVWCALRMVDGTTQYPRVSYKDASVQTTTKTFSDQGVQNKPTTRHRMVETSVRILYQPELETAQATTQCGGQPDSVDQ